MKWLSFSALILFVSITLGQSDSRKEQGKFQGAWVVESVLAEGKEIPGDIIKAFKMTFKDDNYTVAIGQEKTEGTFRVDPAKEPKTIDIMPDNGPDRGRIQTGIYTFDGEKLKICAAQPGKERPKDFETKDKPGYSVMILKKA